ncbi:MAG: beta-lactamase family protein [Clostridiales bacterium]|nr:beta-lactamase family protein [Clostridiales bacterium]
MKRFKILLLCLMLIFPAAVRASAPDDIAIDQMFKAANTIGGSVVIMKEGRVVYARDYGFKNLRSKLPVDENTYFRAASITKMITGIGLMKLVDEGRLALDADISEYFGYQIANGYYPRIPITLRQLMSHTSSISEGGGYSSKSRKVAQMLAKKVDLRGNYYKEKPGSTYRYSNFGAGLTGSLMEAVTGLSINRYMQQAIFTPLGIDAAYSASLLQRPDDVSNQYKNGVLDQAVAGQLRKTYEDFADPESHYRITMGDAWLTSRDMAKLTGLLSADGSVDSVRILSPQSTYLMRQEQMTLNQSVTGPSPYGLFLEHNDTLLPDKTVYGHQGMSDGAILNCYFEPDSDFVFVLFSNGGSMVRENRIGKLARKMFAYFYDIYGGNTEEFVNAEEATWVVQEAD